MRSHRLSDDLYVRSVNGQSAAWFRGAQSRPEGHIESGGVAKDVTLVKTETQSNAIDAAYRGKYRRYAKRIVESIVTPQARAATIKLVPRT